MYFSNVKVQDTGLFVKPLTLGHLRIQDNERAVCLEYFSSRLYPLVIFKQKSDTFFFHKKKNIK